MAQLRSLLKLAQIMRVHAQYRADTRRLARWHQERRTPRQSV